MDTDGFSSQFIIVTSSLLQLWLQLTKKAQNCKRCLQNNFWTTTFGDDRQDQKLDKGWFCYCENAFSHVLCANESNLVFFYVLNIFRGLQFFEKWWFSALAYLFHLLGCSYSCCICAFLHFVPGSLLINNFLSIIFL